MEIQAVASKVSPEKLYANKLKPHPGDFSKAISEAMANADGSATLSEACNKNESGLTRSPETLAVGTITQNTPTVSDLLIEHPEYGKKCWQIIHSEVNKGKSFTSIQPGTTIYFNKTSMEISWSEKSGSADPPLRVAEANPVLPSDCAKPIGETGQLSSQLATAVKTYMGRPYKEIDCYELLVNGLVDMGVRYSGDGGLQEHLMKSAVDKGLSTNAYLSGEGIISTLGDRLYSNFITDISNPEEQANRVIKEMQAFNQKGFILSFSTPTRGHTGVVSQKDDTWTFINSGRMDHRMGGAKISKGVGEESLNDEIRNWFRLAAHRKESLQVTLGRLDETKLAGYFNGKRVLSEKA